jgi:hypothetical protein
MYDPNRYNHRNAFEGFGWLIAGLILLPMTLVCLGITVLAASTARRRASWRKSRPKSFGILKTTDLGGRLVIAHRSAF